MKTNVQYSNQQLTPNGTTVDLQRALVCDVNHDADSLLGNRFLCRGSGGLLVGQSGIGKSTCAFQMACHWAVGKDFFGICPTSKEPMKVLLVQSENDALEIAEVLQSVTENWDPAEVELLLSHLMVANVWNKQGAEFGAWLREATTKFNPDLVIVDPLMGFLGADVLSNEAITTFMREYINNALKNPPAGCRQFGMIFVHHTGKPSGNGRKGEKPTSATRMYDMLGASELVNWARCIMRLDSAIERGRAVFLIPKRGDRSGVPFLSAEEEWGCFVRHAEPNPNSQKRVMCWASANSMVASAVTAEDFQDGPKKRSSSKGKAKAIVEHDQGKGQNLREVIAPEA